MKVLKVKGDEKFSAVRWNPAMIKKELLQRSKALTAHFGETGIFPQCWSD